MLNTQESIDFFKNLKESLSAKRFSGYQMGGSELDAFAKYLWNIQLCESLCPSFQLLEVAFRNKIHSQVGIAIKDASWILHQHGIIYPEEQETIRKAKENLNIAHCPVTEDYLVSEMKFGFWTSLLNARYERLWPKIIGDVFPDMPKLSRTRADASILMNGVRKLRNAALHHHSIWHWRDLKDRHNQMRLMIGYICAQSASAADQIDRFPVVQSIGMGECQKMAAKILKSVQKLE
ncbi:MAG TPA: hypothetical protein VGI03_13650 [Verrucomicrobiae bacterium]|jgi:hypothetical protein